MRRYISKGGLGGFQRNIMERPRRTKKLSVTVNKEYISMINDARGLISKSAFVNDILRREFESKAIKLEA
jgi:hypothetical protein